MTTDELQQSMSGFLTRVKEYRTLLSNSRDATANIVANQKEIDEIRSKLIREYGGLEAYIKTFGNDPKRSDVGGGPYPVYKTAFSNDILQRRGPCIDAVVDDLNYILGRFNHIDLDELNQALNTPKKEESEMGFSA